MRKLLFLPCLVLLVSTYVRGEPASSPDRSWYDYLVKSEFTGLEDISLDFDLERSFTMPILLPDPALLQTQHSSAGIRTFSAKTFPEDFRNLLIPETADGITTYRITAYEDPITRERVFLNPMDQELGRISAPPGYNPLDYATDTFGGMWAVDDWDWLAAVYDPARIIVQYTFVEDADIWKYVLKGSLDAAAHEKAEKERKEKLGGGIIIMKAYTGAPVEHLVLTSVDSTNNALNFTLAYPWTPGDPTNSFTNRVEILCCTNLVDYWWFSLGTTNVTSTTNWIEWSDTSFTNTNNIVRFYRIGNADLDSDSDGLLDARELNMYHSSPSTNDTDNDTLSDYNEVINLNTDPSNSNTSKPIVSITCPTNNFTWVWMP